MSACVKGVLPSGPLAEIAEAWVWFRDFAASYQREESSLLLLKVRHTERVVGLAGNIVAELGLAEGSRRSALLAALLHDVGRFPQFAQWRTFRDDISANHGRLGARVLRDASVLKAEAPAVRRAAIAAVALHNRYVLPANLPEQTRLITNIVRDADKIDILRIFSEELSKPEPSGEVVLHVAREPERWTPAVADMIVRGLVPEYRQLRYVNDFIMLLCSWPAELNFPVSLRLVREAGHVGKLMEHLPGAPELDAVRQAAREFLLRGKSGRQALKDAMFSC
jgi:hypothetical protein